jgi:hypothetical protein
MAGIKLDPHDVIVVVLKLVAIKDGCSCGAWGPRAAAYGGAWRCVRLHSVV